ncbi:MAG: hypothetical protein FWD74_00010 [Actinomycetia bacterium]|nr:hypothetical protein [Actinomycetes bacterium]
MRLIKTAVATAAVAALALGALVGVANATSANPQVWATLLGPTSAPVPDAFIGFCNAGCLSGAGSRTAVDLPSVTDFGYTNTNGVLPYLFLHSDTKPTAVLRPGAYKIVVANLDPNNPAVNGGVTPSYIQQGTGYLQQTSTGTFVLTSNFAAATTFTVNTPTADAPDTDLGELSLAPFVRPSNNPASIALKSGGTSFCPNYTVKATLPAFPSGVTVKVTAYSTTSSTLPKNGILANQKAVWTTSYAATGAAKAVTYTPPSSLADKYLAFGLTASRANTTSWTAIWSPLKLRGNTCPVATSWVKAWSKKNGGSLQAGKNVSISATTFKQSGMKAKYTWLVNGKSVKSGASRSLALNWAWGGQTLKVKVTVTRAGNKALAKTITVGKIAY